MSTNEPVSLTRGEVVDLHLNPDCLFCSERLPDHPVDVRYGDDRVQRFSNGSISVFLGYYTPSQIIARNTVSTYFAKVFAEKMKESGGWFRGAAQ